MPFRKLIARLPYPSTAVQRAVGIAAVVSLALVAAGGSVVRVTGSGLGCPTWPQCVRGSMVPVARPQYAVLNQWIEFGNRMLTGAVVVVAALCALTAWRVRIAHPQRRRLVWLAWTMPLGVVVEAVVGGLTVLAKLEWWTVAIHFLATAPLVWLAVLLAHAFREGDGPARRLLPRSGRAILVLLVAVLGGVLAAGTTVTGAGPHGGAVDTHRLDAPIETLARVHGGLVVTYLVVLAVFGLQLLRVRAPRPLWARYALTWAVALGQGILGSVQYALGVPETLVSFHVIGSVLVIIATAALWCATRDRGVAPDVPGAAPIPEGSEAELAVAG